MLGGASGYADFGGDEETITCEIRKCQLSGVTAPSGIPSLVYTGQPQDLITPGAVNDKHGAAIAQLYYWLSDSSSDSSSNAEPQSLSSPQGTDAGEYHVWYAAQTTDPSHQEWVKDQYKCITVTISKATPTATVTGREGLVYNGEEQQLLQRAETNLDGVQLQFSVDDNTHYRTSMPTAKDAGEHMVYYKADAVANTFNAIPENSVKVTIAKADADLSAGDKVITYGDPLTLEATVKVKGVQLTAVQTPPEANKVKFYVDNGGAGNSRYTLLGPAEGTAVTYDDGDNDSGKATVTLQASDYKNALKSGDNTVVAVYGGSDNLLAGNVSLNGGYDNDVKVVVNKKTLTYTVTAENKSYADVTQDSPNPSNVVKATLTATEGGILAGDTVTIAATAKTDSSDVDTYDTVDLSNIRVTDKDSQYYTVAETSRDDVTLTAPVSITPVSPQNNAGTRVKAPTARTLTYTGQERELVIAGSAPGGCTIQYSRTGSSCDATIPKATDVNEAGYTIYWKVVPTSNTRGKKNYLECNPVNDNRVYYEQAAADRNSAAAQNRFEISAGRAA